MDGQQKIIDKIISDATAEAGEILSEAVKKAEEIVEKSRGEAQAEYDAFVKKAQKSGEETVKRRLTVSELEVKKIVLSAKKQAVDNAFDVAAERLCSLPKDEYVALVGAMIASAASDGDVVTVAEKDKKLFTKAYFSEISEKIGKRLVLSDTFGDFSGGVILSGHGVDKNLTFESELKLLRDEIEPEVAKIMFSNGSKS